MRSWLELVLWVWTWLQATHIAHGGLSSFALPDFHNSSVELKSVAVIDNHNVIHTISVAKFVVRFKGELFHNGHAVFRPDIARHSKFFDTMKLTCNKFTYIPHEGMFGIMLAKPLVLDQGQPNPFAFLAFLRSLTYFDAPRDSERNVLEFFVSLDDLGSLFPPHAHKPHVLPLLHPADVSTCTLHFHGEGHWHFTNGKKQKLRGDITFTPAVAHTLATELGTGPGYFTHALFSVAEVLTSHRHNVTADSAKQGDVFLQTGSSDERPVNPRTDDTLMWTMQNPNMRHIAGRFARMFPSFLEASNRVHHLMNIRTTSHQVFSAAIDPLINDCPPEIAKAVVQAVTEKVCELLIDPVSAGLNEVFTPHEALADIENIPTGAVPTSLPIVGDAMDVVRQVQESGDVFLQETFQALALAHAKGSPGDSVTGIIKAKLASQIANYLIENTLPHVVNLLDSGLATSMRVIVNRTVSRGTIQSLTTDLTEHLTHSLVKLLCDLFARSLIRLPTRQLTRALTPALTFALAMTLHHSLTRYPMNDYLCFFCREHTLYCDECQAVMAEEYYRDVYSSYYAHHYATYYGGHYGTAIADWFVDNYHNQNPFGEPNPIPPSDLDATGVKRKPHAAPGNEWGSASTKSF